MTKLDYDPKQTELIVNTLLALKNNGKAEGEELHGLARQDIDAERGIISVRGHKGHDSGTNKLRAATAEMLRDYITRNPQNQPFPKPKVMSQQWLKTRNRLADDTKQSDLKKIPMKSLRNYSGAQLYYALPDPIAVMRHLRHKKLETTMHHLRAIVLDNGEEDYVCKVAKTIDEATQLIENGFQYVTEMDGIKLFRKRK